MKIHHIKSVSIKRTLEQIRSMPLYTHPSAFMWRKCLSVNNQFCEAVVHSGYLSWEQMFSASCRYCVGASKLRGVIFWQIDHEGRVHDGKVMYYLPDCHRNKDRSAHPTWVSALLAKRNRHPRSTSSHCFFGQHLLAEDAQCSMPVAIVEAEKSAFILSELYPEYIWLATGGLCEVQPDKFRPLRGRKVVMFPDTDSTCIAFRRWSEAADEVAHSVFWEGAPPIRVSPLLELNATPEQKERKIDLVDFLFEN